MMKFFKRISRNFLYAAIILIPPMLPFFIFAFYNDRQELTTNETAVVITRDALEKDYNRFTPRKIFHVGMYIQDLANVQVADRTFQGRFVFWTKNFYDKSANDRADLKAGIKLVNADELNIENRGEGSGQYASYEASGTLKNEFYLPDYPFDTHKLLFIFEPRDMTAEEIFLVADPNSSITSGVSIGDWEIKSFEARSEIATAKNDFSDPSLIKKGALWTSVPRVVFEVEIQRKMFSHLIKELLPLLIILLMAFTNLFIDPDEFGSKLQVAFTSFLSVAALHWVAGEQTGVSYLTAMDKFFLVAFSLVLLICVEALLSREFSDSSNGKSEKLHPRWFRYGVPAIRIVYLIVLVVTWYWIAFTAITG